MEAASPSANDGNNCDATSRDPRDPRDPRDRPSTNSQDTTSVPDPAAFHGQYQNIPLPSPTPRTLSGQRDTTRTQMPAPAYQGLYNMSAMANALEQPGYYDATQEYLQRAHVNNNVNVDVHVLPPSLLSYDQQYYVPSNQQVPSAYYHYQPQGAQQQQQQQQYSQQQHYPPQQHYSQMHQQQSTAFTPSYPIMGARIFPSHGVNNQQHHPYYYPQPNQYALQHNNNPYPVHNHNLYSQPYIYQPDGSAGFGTGSFTPQGNHSSREASGLSSTELEAHGNSPSIVRGPPRKPRQNGHAIWIGNLPPGTELMSLVEHVCRETAGLQSLFLISKSNCAFANFKDEETCSAAQRNIHDSRFRSVRLVSRLRKSTVEGASGQTAPTGPAATISPSVHSASDVTPPTPNAGRSDDSTPASPGSHTDTSSTEDARAEGSRPGAAITPPIVNGTRKMDRFFILKSLTEEDLHLSVQNGVWATQSHNEQVLNNAFATAETVFLIFSANKSGRYFGYAKMTSAINDDPAAAIRFTPNAHSMSNVELPKEIIMPATDTRPHGRIIDDSARGTIFWEVYDEESGSQDGGEGQGQGQGQGQGEGEGEGEGEGVSTATAAAETATTTTDGGRDQEAGPSAAAQDVHEDEGDSQAWGKPFQLEWLSTVPLPFFRTRGMRNALNANREVKIARDGTELDPVVGKRIIGLFNRAQNPVPDFMSAQMSTQMSTPMSTPMSTQMPAQMFGQMYEQMPGVGAGPGPMMGYDLNSYMG
ncbi:hypothetical protein GGR50DRAFT_401759 [Xylaria sp. CBS 124048]|nr:hypothetical protein GGR50DRAFT_401759 [Xylaria sp. CBS 124048]